MVLITIVLVTELANWGIKYMAKYQFGWKTENFKNKHLLSHIKML